MKEFATFEEAVGAFFDGADWLTDNESPAMTALMKAAQSLDTKMSATMLAEFGKVFRYLRNLKPDEDIKHTDALDDFIESL